MRRGARQLGASPVLIGAVTVMIAIVAVFISYQANNGLPFVPTYQLEAQVPNGAKLVKGNEVRAGGFRVGIVKDIKSARIQENGTERVIAVLDLKLDKSIEPLAVDTTLLVRPRSALGLKYVELIPGRASKTFQDGDTIPIKNASPNAPELEDVLSSFPPETRADARKSLQGFGNSIAGRGPAINTTIRELEPFTRYLLPVMRNLSDPKTELRGFFPGLGAATAQAAPVAQVQARWFGEMATTFAAIGRDPEALRETIEESPSTLQAATESFQVQTPFLARFAAVSRDLQPGAAELPRTLPLVNDALQAGVPAFEQTPQLGEDLEDLFEAAEDLGDNPNTLLALKDLRTGVRVTRPALEFVAPYQTVCNFLVYFFNPLGTHQSATVAGGTTERILAKLVDTQQPNSLGTTESTKPVDGDPNATPAQQSLHTQYGGPAIDSSGRADCQGGQTGYPNSLSKGDRWNAEAHRRGRQHPRPRGRDLQVARARHRQPEGRAMSVFKAGILALTTLLLLAYFGFTKANPFANPYELKAMFRDVESLKPRSPVRIAGVEVGKVTKVEPKDGGGAAEVTMELQERRAPDPHGRPRPDPLAHLPRGQLLRGHPARFAVGRRARGRLDHPDHADDSHGDAAGHPRHARLGRPRRPPDVPSRVRHRGPPGRRREGVQPRDPVLRARLPLWRTHERRAARSGSRPRRAAAAEGPAEDLRRARGQPQGAQGAGHRPEHHGGSDREPGRGARGVRAGPARHAPCGLPCARRPERRPPDAADVLA